MSIIWLSVTLQNEPFCALLFRVHHKRVILMQKIQNFSGRGLPSPHPTALGASILTPPILKFCLMLSMLQCFLNFLSAEYFRFTLTFVNLPQISYFNLHIFHSGLKTNIQRQIDIQVNIAHMPCHTYSHAHTRRRQRK